MNKQEQQQYEQIDMPFYKNEISEIAPALPDKLLDFHTHIWTKESWKTEQQQGLLGGKYMVTTKEYTIEALL